MRTAAVAIAIISTVGAMLIAQTGTRPPKTGLHVQLSNAGGALSVSTNLSSQQGWLAEFYDVEDPGSAPVACRRIDDAIDFSWPYGFPDGSCVAPDGTYSVRWTSWVNTPTAGAWTWTTTSDDGVRLWIDGVLVYEDWTIHGPREGSATRTLSAAWHEVRMEMFNRWSPYGVQATARLEYSGPGQPRALVSGAAVNMNPGATGSGYTMTGADGRTYRLKAVVVR